jgi:hypothetical protein
VTSNVAKMSQMTLVPPVLRGVNKRGDYERRGSEALKQVAVAMSHSLLGQRDDQAKREKLGDPESGRGLWLRSAWPIMVRAQQSERKRGATVSNCLLSNGRPTKLRHELLFGERYQAPPKRHHGAPSSPSLFRNSDCHRMAHTGQNHTAAPSI